MKNKILMLVIILFVPSSFVFSMSVTTIKSFNAFAICKEMKDPNVSCGEQYNTKSNIGTAPATADNTTGASANTPEEEDEEENGLSSFGSFAQDTLFDDTDY
jgi:hypothetical protein